MRWLTAALLVLIVLLQYRLWLSPSGVHELSRLQAAVAEQRSDNDRLQQRNRQLAAEVRDLKNGLAALEERARSELGMTADNETFYQVVPAKAAPSAEARTRTAAR